MGWRRTGILAHLHTRALWWWMMERRTFDTVTIIGVGLLGGSYGLALKERGLARRVIGVPRRAETIPKAIEIGAIDEGGLDPVSAVAEAELVVLATPVLQMPGILRAITPAAPVECVLSDAGSSKTTIANLADSLSLSNFVGGHPMAGSEKKGVEHSRADLFVGATYFLTPTDQTDEAALSRVRELVVALGAAPVVFSPERHDRVVAVTSHLPHLLAASLLRLALATSESEPLTRKGMATGLRDLTRIASGDVEMWRDIYLSNRGPLLQALDALGDICAEARTLLEKEDASAISEWLAAAREFREEVYGSASGGSDRGLGPLPALKSRDSSLTEDFPIK